jgi:uncharacterized damage-inducible protein DinB
MTVASSGTIASEFVKVAADTLRVLSGRIETCVAKLTPEQIWTRGGDQQNAIGNLVLHLSGNVRQWIVSGVGGAQDVRQRDAEFAAREGQTAEDLLSRLRSTVTEAQSVIAALTADQLLERIEVQNHDVTKLEAIFHVVEHFSGHTFQIIFATKLLTNRDLAFYPDLNPPQKPE